MLEEYHVSCDINDMDIDVIHGFISNSYWAKGIPRETLIKGMQNSLCFAVLDTKQRQVGFARMITDKTSFAYLADVFVLPTFQGKGLSKLLMTSIVEHPDLQGLRRMMLNTSDAHGLYEKYGFKSLSAPEKCMEKWQPRIYEKS